MAITVSYRLECDQCGTHEEQSSRLEYTPTGRLLLPWPDLGDWKVVAQRLLCPADEMNSRPDRRDAIEIDHEVMRGGRAHAR